MLLWRHIENNRTAAAVSSDLVEDEQDRCHSAFIKRFLVVGYEVEQSSLPPARNRPLTVRQPWKDVMCLGDSIMGNIHHSLVRSSRDRRGSQDPRESPAKGGMATTSSRRELIFG